jgi:hypothetical protein
MTDERMMVLKASILRLKLCGGVMRDGSEEETAEETGSYIYMYVF